LPRHVLLLGTSHIATLNDSWRPVVVYMVIIKTCQVKKLFNKFLEISGKIGITAENFWTHNRSGKLSDVLQVLEWQTTQHLVNQNRQWKFSTLSQR